MKSKFSEFGGILFGVVCIGIILWAFVLRDSQKENVSQLTAELYRNSINPDTFDFTKKEVQDIDLISWNTDEQSKEIYLKLYNGTEERISSIDFQVSLDDDTLRVFRTFPLNAPFAKPKSNVIFYAKYDFSLLDSEEPKKLSGRIVAASYDQNAVARYEKIEEKRLNRIVEILKSR